MQAKHEYCAFRDNRCLQCSILQRRIDEQIDELAKLYLKIATLESKLQEKETHDL